MVNEAEYILFEKKPRSGDDLTVKEGLGRASVEKKIIIMKISQEKGKSPES